MITAFLTLSIIIAQIIYRNRDQQQEEQHEQDVFNACLGRS